MVGHSITRAPMSSSRLRKSADWEAARVMTIVLPVSAILGDLGKNLSRSLGKQSLTKLKPQFNRMLRGPAGFVGDDALSIETCDQSFDREPLSLKVRFSSNGNLAAAAQHSQESPLGSDSCSCRNMVQDLKYRTCGFVI